MRGPPTRLLPLISLILSTMLVLLGHIYLVCLPEYRVDALLFYIAAGLLGLVAYRHLDRPGLRFSSVLSALGHVAASGVALFGGSEAWLGLPIGAAATIVLAPVWIALALPFYQAIVHLLAGRPIPEGELSATPVSTSPAQAAQRQYLQREHLGLIAGGGAFGLALSAQLLLNQHKNPLPGTLLYLAAAGIVTLGLWRDRGLWRSVPSQQRGEEGGTTLTPGPSPSQEEGRKTLVSAAQRRWLIRLAVVAGALNFVFSGGNRFTALGVLMWIVSVGALMLALWERKEGAQEATEKTRASPNYNPMGWIKIDVGGRGASGGIRLGWWSLLIIALVILGVFFRFYRLPVLPAEMNSDHAEKLLDVHDVLNGEYRIFFPRNTGREAWQFYWSVGLVRLFNLPPDFQTLKIGSSLVGSLMLPGLYVLGAEVLGPAGGMWTLLFGGVTSWSVITTRFGLRYPFMQMPVVWSLALLARAARRERRNDFLLMGLIWGIGFYGYQSYRAMALALPAAFVVWYIFSGRWRRPGNSNLWRSFAGTLGVAGLVLVPLVRFSIDFPHQFWTRILTRVTGAERPIEGSPALIFLDNMRRALLSFFWYGDEVWVAGIPNVPIIDPILGALIVCGLVALLLWSLRRKDALPIALVVATVAMTSPSAAAISFPRENPSAIRLGGMIPGVMVICATLPALFVYRWWDILGKEATEVPTTHSVPMGESPATTSGLVRREWLRRSPVLVMAAALAIAVVGLNWQRTFETYAESYCARSLNASEVAQAIKGFIRTGGPPENAFYVVHPHWFDSRAIGIWLGDIYWPNTLLDIQMVDGLVPHPGPQMYIIHPDDQKSLPYLWSKFPRGWSSRQPSLKCPGHDFIVFYVPAR